MQADRPTGGRGDAIVPFFGEPAAFPLGPFVLARAAGAPVVPAFCAMAPRRTLPARDRAADLGEARGRAGRRSPPWSPRSSAWSRAYPTQWFNFFDVWSPPGGPRLSAWSIAAAGVVTPDRPGPRGVLVVAGHRRLGHLARSSASRWPTSACSAAARSRSSTRVKDWRGVPDCRATPPADLGGRRPLRAGRASPAAARSRAARGGGGHRARAAWRRARRRSPATAAARRLRGASTTARPDNLARWLGARGPVITVSTACASGATAHGGGGRSAAHGRGGRGGGGRLRRALPLRAARLRRPALAHARRGPSVRPAPQRPAAGRGGRRSCCCCASATRGAARLGTLLGYGSASDGFHIAAPDPEGRGLERAIRMALAEARRVARRDRLRERARHRHAAQRPHRDRARSSARWARGRTSSRSTRSRAASGTPWAPPPRSRPSCACSRRSGA